MADQMIDLTDDSSDVEVCNGDDEIVVVKDTQPRRTGKHSITVAVHGKEGRGAPVSVSRRRQSPTKKQAPAPLPPPAPANAAPKKVLKCPVCLDSLMEKDKRLASTKCGHIFCESCIIDSLKVAKQCPTCRAKLTTKAGFHPIFL